ncbi:reprolysin-like metallopeptidase [Taibaiella soli]|uniref:Secretion system C-terminal sorting domain-containing protein n=1 Tax=Taibaiella soli TaxID=1649169 RepID=A0A2W2BFL5_9BACT|nr:zinc-dependent metalloprotease family protein [Taibaiella soli]PZF75029.1 hypothetical protein DN068_00300 [Taibaiella soli]
MKKIITLLLCAGLTSPAVFASDYSSLWQNVNANQVASTGKQLLHPDQFLVYTANNQVLKSQLLNISEDPAMAQVIQLPMPDGSFRSFRIWQTPMMEKNLSDRYPGINTFTAVATDNKTVTAKIDYTLSGFHAMIFDGANTAFIDPYSNTNDGYYISYYKKDYTRPAGQTMACTVGSEQIAGQTAEPIALNKTGLPDLTPLNRTNGTQKKTYRLALACTGEYSVAVAGASPTKAAVLSHMVTSINRVNGVYEREVAVTMTLIGNEDTLIFLDGTTDPYTNNSGGTMLAENQQTVTNLIGTANYDIGHVFSTGGGGVAFQGCVCSASYKARGVTGSGSPVGDPFDIDYVAHEMGHQYGAGHTFNANTGSCQGNADTTISYEPGSGSTIMAYAGICGAGDNLQQHSDAYFHAASLNQISNYITTGYGSTCAVASSTGNTPNTVGAFNASYNIPFKTPFELTAPAAIDATADTLTYCWEEWDLGDFNTSFAPTRRFGPIFRSFTPDSSSTRVFPTPVKLLANITSYLGEKLPDTSRKLCFRLTTRDIFNGLGCFNFPTDSIHLNVVYTTTPFTVTSPNTAVNWTGATQQTITWNISGTNAAPISCDSVTIYLSVDGGYNYPYTVATVPNNGSATVTIPNVATTTKGRIKVKGNNNVFFNINNTNITLTYNQTAGVPTIVNNADIKIYPVPASDVVNISNNTRSVLQSTVINSVGQTVWKGTITQTAAIAVNSWAKGMYYIRMTDEKGQQSVANFVVK